MTTFLSPKRTILMLGTNVASIDAVKYLQSLGHKVIVTDHLTSRTGAKLHADETASISTQDHTTLLDLVRSLKIDGVLAGVSEVNIRSAIAIAEELSLPYFCSTTQWDQLMDKSQFRSLCIEHGVPSPRTYYSGAAKSFEASAGAPNFPCIIKPVDGSALKGITVCRDAGALSDAVNSASRASRSGHILIESFVEGDEFTAAYVVVDGQAVLSSMDDRYPLFPAGRTTSLPGLRVYPSQHIQAFIDRCDQAVQQLCSATGLENACIFFQGIHNKNETVIFEAGLRLAGEAPYRFLSEVNNANQLHHFVNSSIGEKGNYDVAAEDPLLGGETCAILSFAGDGGTIAAFHGLDTVLALPQVLEMEKRYESGDDIASDGTLRQIVLRFILRCHSADDLHSLIRKIESTIDVVDEDGNSLLIDNGGLSQTFGLTHSKQTHMS